MLKNIDKYEDTAHFSYRDYKRKTHKTPNKDLMVFASVFIVGVLIILGFAKILSPNVDVAITVDDDTVQNEDVQTVSSIDDRLRNLKNEDDGRDENAKSLFTPELDERVVLPQQHRKTVGQIEAEKADLDKSNKVVDQNVSDKSVNEPAKKEQNEVKKPVIPVTARVVVGYYATEKQAEVAKSIIQDTGVNANPVVKNMGGYFTLQVGSFSSKDKAQQFANSLLKSNFPARVILD